MSVVHVTYKALNSKQGEGALHSVQVTGEHLLSSVQPWMVIAAGILLFVAFIVWNLVGKGEGSHAGREEVRRSYRRALAREMAKQDAEKIRRGEKPRRRWMQW